MIDRQEHFSVYPRRYLGYAVIDRTGWTVTTSVLMKLEVTLVELEVEQQPEEELEAISWQAEGVLAEDSWAVVQQVDQQPSQAYFFAGTYSAPNGCPRVVLEFGGVGLVLELALGLTAVVGIVIIPAFWMARPQGRPGLAIRHSSRFLAQVDQPD